MLELTKAGVHIRTLRPDQSFEIELENGEVVHVGAAQNGWTLEDFLVGPYTPPEPPKPKLEDLKVQAKFQVISFADDLTNQIKTAHRGGIPFPQGEEAAWHEKTPEAREIVSIPEDTPLDVTKYPILNTLFDGNDTAMRTEAIKIVYFADRFKKAAALIQKIREETERAIDACNSSEEIAQVLETAKASAQGAMETL